jgi:hypothetical protein
VRGQFFGNMLREQQKPAMPVATRLNKLIRYIGAKYKKSIKKSLNYIAIFLLSGFAGFITAKSKTDQYIDRMSSIPKIDNVAVAFYTRDENCLMYERLLPARVFISCKHEEYIDDINRLLYNGGTEWENKWKGIRHYTNFMNLTYREKEELFKLGISYFGRYSLDTLKRAAFYLINGNNVGKPVVIAIYPKADYNNAFAYQENIDKFIYKKFIFIPIEVKDKKEIIEKISYVTQRVGKISALFIYGHGTEDGKQIQLGQSSFFSKNDKDIIEAIGQYISYEKKPFIFIGSCFAGLKGGIGQNINKLLKAEVIAANDYAVAPGSVAIDDLGGKYALYQAETNTNRENTEFYFWKKAVKFR